MLPALSIAGLAIHLKLGAVGCVRCVRVRRCLAGRASPCSTSSIRNSYQRTPPPPFAAVFDRVHADDRLLIADAAVDEARHDLVALRIEPSFDARLRHAVGELTVAQIVIRRDRDALRTFESRSWRFACPGRRRRVPVREDTSTRRIALSSNTFFNCVPPAAIITFGAPRGGSSRAVEVGVVEEVDVVDHEALLARGTSRRASRCARPRTRASRSPRRRCWSARSSRPATPRDAGSRETADEGIRSGSTRPTGHR